MPYFLDRWGSLALCKPNVACMSDKKLRGMHSLQVREGLHSRWGYSGLESHLPSTMRATRSRSTASELSAEWQWEVLNATTEPFLSEGTGYY